MVQVKKDEVKKAIENAAVDIFLEKGYLNTKMSHIAAKANISVGNIYIYFNNKEELFYTVLPQSFADILRDYNSRIFPILTKAFLKNQQNLERYLPTRRRIDDLIAKRKRLLILLRYSKGTRYENLKEEIMENMTQHEIAFLQECGMDNCNMTQSYKIIRMVFDNMLNLLLDSLEDDMEVNERRNVVRFSYEYNLNGFIRLLREYIK
ncbi:TetR/AcrR family transcriptional regulator [Clostridium scatologenes]|uniref:Transcriptional regulator, TetR family n=1 Tax=Clostridium scatologenes TaxID=1548 RepID=A0A0E3M7H3_CLOSL|nr:TetR/AcrR family transcriptional regulator [Clostridium scatologenes]AKA67772.1 transcriptional regulator, TetR family [Clostridium scatologenes]